MADNLLTQEVVELPARVAAIEVQIKNIVSSVKNLSDTVSEMVSGMSSLSREIGSRGQVNWGIVIAICGLVTTIVSGTVGIITYQAVNVGSLQTAQGLQAAFTEKAIESLSSDLLRHSESTGHAQIVGELTALSGELNLSLKEVETQINGLGIVRNLDRERQDLVETIIWRKLTGESLNGDIYYPRMGNR